MDYSQISIFLDKLKQKFLQKEDLYIDIKNLIEEKLHIVLEIDNIKISNNKINIKTSPIVKNEILLNKKSILKKINTKYNNRFIDIS